MNLGEARGRFTKKERVNIKQNPGEILIGYKLIQPNESIDDLEGLTQKEAGTHILYRLDTIGKYKYIQQLVKRPSDVEIPALMVPVYVSKTIWNQDCISLTIRTFAVHTVYEYERAHWFSPKRLVRRDYLRLSPDISEYVSTSEGYEADYREYIKRWWEGLHFRAMPIEYLLHLLSLTEQPH
jgi:hypothetical protein